MVMGMERCFVKLLFCKRSGISTLHRSAKTASGWIRTSLAGELHPPSSPSDSWSLLVYAWSVDALYLAWLWAITYDFACLGHKWHRSNGVPVGAGYKPIPNKYSFTNKSAWLVLHLTTLPVLNVASVCKPTNVASGCGGIRRYQRSAKKY